MNTARREREPRADYGIERLDLVYVLIGVGVLALAIAVAFKLGWLTWVGTIPLLICTLLLSSAMLGKTVEREHIVDLADITPESTVLDVGTGRGLLGIAAARRLTTGKVYGVDSWEPAERGESEITPAEQNAIAEGVAGHFVVQQAELDQLPFPDKSFDAVISGFALSSLPGIQQERAVKEIARVLKPGGNVVLLDNFFSTGQFVPLLQEVGLYNVQHSFVRPTLFPPVRVVTAKKPLS